MSRLSTLEDIDYLDAQLLQHLQNKIAVDTTLTRSMVSFQANKDRAAYRWYKYKEAFSASLVEYLFNRYQITSGRILDPFAGSGTALFVAAEAGIDADGIELLPVGQQIIAVRECIENKLTPDDLLAIKRWTQTRPWKSLNTPRPLTVLRITRGAYPEQTHQAIEQYMGAWQHENEQVQIILRFALLCVLESISYTRRDGQYLRWDYRSGRQQGKKNFNKGPIPDFDEAICTKLDEILQDLSTEERGQMELFPVEHARGAIRLYNGSCLDMLPTLPGDYYDAINYFSALLQSL